MNAIMSANIKMNRFIFDVGLDWVRGKVKKRMGFKIDKTKRTQGESTGLVYEFCFEAQYVLKQSTTFQFKPIVLL